MGFGSQLGPTGTAGTPAQFTGILGRLHAAIARQAKLKAAETAPPAPPPSTTAVGSTALEAARLAAEKRRKLATAGTALSVSKPATPAATPRLAPRTLIGF